MAAAPKNHRGGRKPRAAGDVQTLTVRMVAPERGRLRKLARVMGVSESEAVRVLVRREADALGLEEE